jgi:hypothetical protein
MSKLFWFMVTFSSIHFSYGSSTTAGLAECMDQECVREIIPRESKVGIKLQDCAVLNGKADDEGRDLELFCRLALARNHASFRVQSACENSDELNPDWDIDLSLNYLRGLQNEIVYKSLISKFKLSPLGFVERGGAINTSTVDGTLIYEIVFPGKAGGKNAQIAFATYNCLSRAPRRYTAYYFRLRVDNKLVADGEVAGSAFADAKVLEQTVPILKDVRRAELLDLDASGQPDLVYVTSRETTNTDFIGACLHNKIAPACVQVPEVELKGWEYSGDYRFKLNPDHSILVQQLFLNSVKSEATFMLTKQKLMRKNNSIKNK